MQRGLLSKAKVCQLEDSVSFCSGVQQVLRLEKEAGGDNNDGKIGLKLHQFVSFISAHLDVSVRNVHVVEILDGRANVPHNLRCLWEEKRKTQSLKPEAIPVSHTTNCEGAWLIFSLCHVVM